MCLRGIEYYFALALPSRSGSAQSDSVTGDTIADRLSFFFCFFFFSCFLFVGVLCVCFIFYLLLHSFILSFS